MTELSREQALASLRWQMEMGAVEGIRETPVNRFELAEPAPEPRQAAPVSSVSSPSFFPTRPGDCETLEELHQAIGAFPSPLKAGARQAVIFDGSPQARLMVIGEAPGAEEDRRGLPFTGPSGKLLDRALARIGLDRHAGNPKDSFYLTNIAYWRPPGNRNPTAEEILPLMPFCQRHIALVQPELLLLLGNIACQNLLKTHTGITKLRGSWMEYTPPESGRPIPVMPSFHTAYLLRNPAMKRLFWRDMLEIRLQLEKGGP